MLGVTHAGRHHWLSASVSSAHIEGIVGRDSSAGEYLGLLSAHDRPEVMHGCISINLLKHYETFVVVEVEAPTRGVQISLPRIICLTCSEYIYIYRLLALVKPFVMFDRS